MPASGWDNQSNYVAGVRVTSKNQGAVGPTKLKTGNGDSALAPALLALTTLADVDTYLAASTAHGVGYYTARKLAQMTKRDKIYAAQLIADPNSMK